MSTILLPTTVVGSYPQPDWLIDRVMLSKGVPRVNMHEMWRIAPPLLAQAQDDATLLAIAELAPHSLDELQGVSGIGAKKLEAYGQEVLRVVVAA